MFCFVGGLNTLIAYAVYSLLLLLLGRSHYQLWNVIGDIAGGVNSYLWNSRWVFRNQRTAAIPKFIITFIIYAAASALLMTLCVDGIGMNAYLAKVIVLPIVTLLNFFMSKLWTFRQKRDCSKDN